MWLEYARFRVHLAGGVEKWEDRKIVGGWKSGRIEKILFSLLFVWLGVEKWRDGKNEFE